MQGYMIIALHLDTFTRLFFAEFEGFKGVLEKVLLKGLWCMIMHTITGD